MTNSYQNIVPELFNNYGIDNSRIVTDYLFILIPDALPASLVYAGLTIYQLPLSILARIMEYY